MRFPQPIMLAHGFVVHSGAFLCKFDSMHLIGLQSMSDTDLLKRFTVSLDAQDYEALCALAQAQRPPLSLQYTVRLAIRRFLDEHEGRAITLSAATSPAKRSKR